jgi:hypothetical protein
MANVAIWNAVIKYFYYHECFISSSVIIFNKLFYFWDNQATNLSWEFWIRDALSIPSDVITGHVAKSVELAARVSKWKCAPQLGHMVFESTFRKLWSIFDCCSLVLCYGGGSHDRIARIMSQLVDVVTRVSSWTSFLKVRILFTTCTSAVH